LVFVGFVVGGKCVGLDCVKDIGIGSVVVIVVNGTVVVIVVLGGVEFNNGGADRNEAVVGGVGIVLMGGGVIEGD